MILTQSLRRARQMRGAEPAVIYADRVTDWTRLVDRIARLAAALRGLGMGPGDRVALLAHNSDRTIESYFAPLWGGGVFMPLNARLAEPELASQIADAEPMALLVDEAHLDLGRRLAAVMTAGAPLVYAGEGDAPVGTLSYEGLIAGATPIEDAARGADEMACLFYTGGTTGRGKGVMLSHQNLFANALNVVGPFAMDETTVHLHTGPLYHLGAGARVYGATVAAATHVVLPRYDAAETLATIAKHKVTLATFVPTMLGMMLHHPAFGSHDLSSLKLITYGAAPMPEALLVELMRRLPGVRFAQSYGMTELSPVATVLTPRFHTVEGPDAGHLRSGGRAALLAEVKIVDAGDQEVPLGTVGEIAVRGPMVMLGYWRQPEATAQALRGGWMHTGDAGFMDEAGFVTVVDRIKDVIISGGENVYSIEVEDTLHQHPAIDQCAVFGIPDPLWGERVHAVVSLKSGQAADPLALIEHCRARIAHYKCPKTLDIHPGRLPLSGANKIDKTALRALYRQPADPSQTTGP